MYLYFSFSWTNSSARDKKGGLDTHRMQTEQSQPEQRDPSHSVQVVLLKRSAKREKSLHGSDKILSDKNSLLVSSY